MADQYDAAIDQVMLARRMAADRKKADEERRAQEAEQIRMAALTRRNQSQMRGAEIFAELDKFAAAANRRKYEIGLDILSLPLPVDQSEELLRREWRIVTDGDGTVVRRAEFTVWEDGKFDVKFDGKSRGVVDILTIEPRNFAVGFSTTVQALLTLPEDR